MWRKDEDYIGKRLLRMEVPGKGWGRPKRRYMYMYVVREDLKTMGGKLKTQLIEVSGGDAFAVATPIRDVLKGEVQARHQKHLAPIAND